MKDERTTTSKRGEEGRRALIAAAIEGFGRFGYDAISTRSIARQAGVNQAMISYYFGGKEGLYLATIEHIAESLSDRIGPVAAAVLEQHAKLEEEPDSPPEAYLELVYRITDRLVEVMSSEETRAWARIILREQQDPSPAFDVLYQRFIGRIVEPLSYLLNGARGDGAQSTRDRIRVLTVVGQVIVFRAANAAVIKLMGWKRIGPCEVTEIQSVVRDNIAAIAGDAK